MCRSESDQRDAIHLQLLSETFVRCVGFMAYYAAIRIPLEEIAVFESSLYNACFWVDARMI